MDFLKLLPVFTKCSLLYPNIPVGEDQIVCISRLWTIVNRHSGFKFLISVSDNFTVEQCTATFDTHIVSTMGYPYCIVFDRDTLFMLFTSKAGQLAKDSNWNIQPRSILRWTVNEKS